MDDLLLHPRTKLELTALLADPPQALLFIAPAGAGKFTLANAWAHQLGGGVTISTLEPDEKGTITIDATRSLYQRTRSKQAGRQVVIVDHAEAMSGEAQNAFLKLLEEPRQNLTFILTATGLEDLLPTILSRVQVVMVQPIASQNLASYAKNIAPDASDQALQQLLFVANGRPATVVALLRDNAAFERAKLIMQRAKKLLSASQYERLAMVQELAKDKIELNTTLEAMAHMLKLQIMRGGSAPQWLTLADTLQECLRRLRQNGNPRAQLVHLFTTY